MRFWIQASFLTRKVAGNQLMLSRKDGGELVEKRQHGVGIKYIFPRSSIRF